MAKVQGAEIVWTSADMADLLQDKARLQEIIDQIPSNPAAESRTEFQDPCPAFVRWVVSNSNDDQFPDDLTRMQAPKKGNAPAKGKGPRKR